MTTSGPQLSPREEGRSAPAHLPGAPAGASPAIDVAGLFAAYGEAMRRVGELDKETELLRGQLRTQGPGAAATGPGGEETDRTLRERDDTIISLRLQITMLSAQLQKMEERAKETAEGASMRRRRRHQRPWWQRLFRSLLRLLGFRSGWSRRSQ